MIDILGIKTTLPHRYPFLMVDRVIEIVNGESARGIKNVTINEPFFQGHFPDNPVMPGVLIVEALAQLSGILAFQSGMKGNTVYFMSIEKAKFRRPVVPGDQLILDIKVAHKRGNVWRFTGKAMVEEAVASEAEFTAMVAQRE
ncbi:MAG: 3-hydroxyacyl-ACP dehydratase FabZ [Candidatus Magnetobacterium sp. LHC-1]|uniref:3-hydroxyacyl-[acyl-carrier-protein] dehydratase FabZ n=1 Tax=Candidatus Magnetobacterium casense TaxID=1455061 RepID=A0ABS6RTW8_9BACT|nr:3-hydroxyacyl-ACP dehydratase FabZ [Candidatus Magnetobacterium casensis]MBF0606122.1 3-hydroxyacyl-ACP dehydratase FabZ [Nitrospirota bacterium]MBV6340066.1 3-hydroxyacyl-ACP dehydratase FabZ [Candidatus Magnetobacterium casensis]